MDDLMGIDNGLDLFGFPTPQNADVKIFNRNGNLILHFPKNFLKWDGKINGSPVPMGTYYYLIDLHINQPVISGWLLVLR